jgi:hypothetical protein
VSEARRPVVRVGGLALGLAVALATSGCVAAGLATGPLMSAVQLIGDRSVERTVQADMQEAWAATEVALTGMAFRVEGRDREEAQWRLRGVADGVTVHARLERVTARLTRMAFRVETGGLGADRNTGEQIHEQVAQVLVATGRAATNGAGAVSAEALTSLEAEVRRMRLEMEERKPSTSTVPGRAPEPAPTLRVEPSAIITVPASAALPTAPGPTPITSVARPVGAVAPIVVEPLAIGAATGVEGAIEAPASSSITSMTAPLRPAAALTPIGPASGSGSGK